MKKGEPNTTKELYQELRARTCAELWEEEVPRFDRGSAKERMQNVALVRAVGVVFSESGTMAEKETVRRWLRGLLQDPQEKIRRYAMAALPKLGSGTGEEGALISLLQKTTVEREKKFLGRALDKIGGAATLEAVQQSGGALLLQTEQKVRATVARAERPSAVRLDAVLADFAALRIHLRGRAGLEGFVREEVQECARTRERFRVESVSSGLVVLVPLAAFSLGDIFALRCSGTVGLVLGVATDIEEVEAIEALARVIASERSRRVLAAFTEGALRYRLDFVGKGHQRGAVRLVANRAYALCQEILNDATSAPWAVDIHPSPQGHLVELRPRLVPDPRYSYRLQDVPAASHPPLAACMARLGGRAEIVWDPFCGSGVELIECALLGGARRIYGTDLSEEAIAITAGNFAAAKVSGVQTKFACCDFRDFAKVEGLGPNSVDLIVSNPPMGRRIPIGNLRQLIADFFAVAVKALRPGGRLVFANPVVLESPSPSLKLQSRQVVDFGGFDCRVEMYLKAGR